MWKTITIAAMMAATLVSASANAHAATPGQNQQAANMNIFGQARAPMGYRQLCEQFPGECQTMRNGQVQVAFNDHAWAQLNEINRSVNAAISPVTDQDLYGTVELWTYPNRYGDCEDYVLLKRLMLIRQGWPAEALLITVVWDEIGEGHAVLTVTTDAGDLILDNKHDEIKRWQNTGYIFEKRQASFGQGSWVWLRPDRPGA